MVYAHIKKSLCLLLVLLCIFTACTSTQNCIPSSSDDPTENSLRPFSMFSNYICEGADEGLIITIYYKDVPENVSALISEEELISGAYNFKFTTCWIDSNEPIITRISRATLYAPEEEGEMDVRICLIFVTNAGTEILRVSMWDTRHNMIVNGTTVQANPVFYDLVVLLLEGEDADIFEMYCGVKYE